MNGTYQVSGGTAASPVTMVAKQPDVCVFGTNTANHATGHFYGQIAATCGRILDLAPVINSQFAVDYLLMTTTNIRYIFPYAINATPAKVPVPHGYGVQSTPGATTYFLQQGIDCCVHYYTGPTYPSAISGETISTNTFYIFATTSYGEDHVGSISVTFNIANTSATLATVIGEGRTIPISGGSFTDTFAYAWTVHVYKIT
jgi:hypothetical protein